MRLALLGLTLVLAAIAAIGVSSLYSARQRYEDRLASAYALEASSGRLLAASVVEEATLRTLPRTRRTTSPTATRAAAAVAIAVAQARRAADGDELSLALIDRVARAQAQLRLSPTASAARTARAAIAALAKRQEARRAQARDDATDDSRTALVAILIGGALALLSALGLVAALIAGVRRPLADLVGAAGRLARGDLGARVGERGPGELRELGMAFNAMARDLEDATSRIDAQRRRLEVTIESLGDGLLVADAEGRVVAANPRASELVPDLSPGTSLREETGQFPPVEEALAGDVTVERGGKTLSVTAARVTGPDAGAGETVWTVRDISERVRLERLKSEFVATASHELRSPLTSIKGFVELLAHGAELTPRQREFVSIILVSTNRLVDLVNDLLDIARIEAGRIEIHRRPTDLREVITEVAELMGPRLADKRQNLEVDVPEDLPRALADPSRVRQIVINLLTNAHLYTAAGGDLGVALSATERSLRLSVSDTGRGMTDDELEHLYERFYRGSDGGAPGTGLGLAIVKSLVDLHGGSIDVRSAPGKGTTFSVHLPRATEAGERPPPRLALRGKRILVIDDEPEVARLIETRLAPFGVDVTVALSGEEGMERLVEERFDAVTLDILMPRMSGFEVLRAIRADPATRDLPIVVVSVFSGREALSGEWVVSKPIDADELADAVGSAVLAGRVRVLVVGRASVRDHLSSVLDDLGIEFVWATNAAAAERLCQDWHFEVALVDAGLRSPEAALAALDLRGRRLRRSVVVFSDGDDPGLARLDPQPVPVDDAGAAVLAVLQADPAG